MRRSVGDSDASRLAKVQTGNVPPEAPRVQVLDLGWRLSTEPKQHSLAMQELRDMNQIEMDSDDKEKRWKEANTPKRVSTRTWCLKAEVYSCFHDTDCSI